MRRYLTVLSLILFACAATAEPVDPVDPFQPANPIVMGRGGSFTATARGYNSFFYNPAGFARDGELTLTSANIWTFFDQDLYSFATDQIPDIPGVPFLSTSSLAGRAFDPESLAGLEDYFSDLEVWVESVDEDDLEAILVDATGDLDIDITSEADLAEIIATAGADDILAFLDSVEQAAADAGHPLPFTVEELVTAVAGSGLPSGFLRVGGMAGIGYVGNGIGLGLFANVDASIDGTNILQASGTAFNTITFVGGLGLTFGNLHLGLSIRPTVFGYTEILAAPLISGLLADVGGGFDIGAIDLETIFANTVFFGSGLGVDAGAVYELGPFSLGLAVKDLLGTRIAYRSTSIDSYVQALRTASLPLGTALTQTEQDESWTIPMKINVGAEFHPKLGVASFLIDPSVSVDLLDLSLALRTFQSGETVDSELILSMLNFGGELNLLRFLSLRAGYYGGFLSGGVGLDLVVAEIQGAIAGDFERDETTLEWGFSNVGGSLEVAVRF